MIERHPDEVDHRGSVEHDEQPNRPSGRPMRSALFPLSNEATPGRHHIKG